MSSAVHEIVKRKISPNFEKLWEYAEKFPEFSQMGKEKWTSFCHECCFHTTIDKLVDNINPVSKTTKQENKEIPLFVKFADKDIQCIGNYNPKTTKDIMFLDLTDMMYSI